MALAISLILALQRFVVPEFSYQWDILGRNVLIVVGSVVVSILGALLSAMLVKNTRFFSRLALANTQEATAGYTVQESSVAERYLHRAGVAETTLRPAGKVRLDDEVVAAESEGSYIEQGKSVKVIRVDGNRLVVREN